MDSDTIERQRLPMNDKDSALCRRLERRVRTAAAFRADTEFLIQDYFGLKIKQNFLQQ